MLRDKSYLRPCLRQLLGDVAADEDGLEVDPEVLDEHPALEDLRRVGQVMHPLLNLLLERDVESVRQTNK